MEQRVRIGIVGAGVFGNYHANKCVANPRIDFVGAYDLDAARAKAMAQKHDVISFDNYAEMLERVDAVIIASAAKHHGHMANAALKAGKHSLIEKPIAATLDEAQQIFDLSKQTGLIVQVGHQERFVARAIGLADIPETPVSIRAYRMGKYSERGTDVSVTLDLMTHDIDLVLWLMGELPHTVTGTTQILHSDSSDVTEANLAFTHGRAQLTASRAADAFKRAMEITYPSGTVNIDFNAKTLVHDTPFDLNIDFAASPVASDSLGAATDSFVSSILDGTPIAVSAQDGYDALKVALMIDHDDNTKRV